MSYLDLSTVSIKSLANSRSVVYLYYLTGVRNFPRLNIEENQAQSV